MPKVTTSTLNSLFAIAKPSGPASMTIVNAIKPLLSSSPLFFAQNGTKSKKAKGRRKMGMKAALKLMVKVGTGGTLDPLADGVLVIALGDATKQLGGFLDCVKEYKTTCLLGCETDSYDSQGVRVRVAPWSHVTRAALEDVLAKFRGEITQTPPIFSALKMDGKPLYEYAREGIPLPRPIPARRVTVHSLEIIDWKDGHAHDFKWPEKSMSDEDRDKLKKAVQSAVVDRSEPAPPLDDDPEPTNQEETPHPPVFTLKMKVSGGTYVRSLAHDIGHAVGSAAHVVTLTRTRQGDFTLEPEKESDKACIPWETFEEALKEIEGPEESIVLDEEGHKKWEAEVLRNIVLFEE